MSNKTFSDKHRELFPYLADGKSDREISKILGVRHSTIYQHVEKMMDVVKCSERADLEQFCKQYLAKEPLVAQNTEQWTFDQLLDRSMQAFKKSLNIPQVVEAERVGDVSNVIEDVKEGE